MKSENPSFNPEVHAHEAAYAANLAFDRAAAAKTAIAAAQGELATANHDFSAAAAMAGAYFDRNREETDAAAKPADTSETNKLVESFASEAVWNAMSPEQRTKAEELRTALAAGRLSEYGVTEDSLRVVMAEDKDGGKHFALTHTGNGIDIGDPKKEFDPDRSYSAVMSPKNDELFQVEVGGVTYDTRGMTDAAYDAKIADARERGVTLPDSHQLSEETGDDWTWTMLSGESLTADGFVPVRDVFDGVVDRRTYPPDDGNRGLRVCPTVAI